MTDRIPHDHGGAGAPAPGSAQVVVAGGGAIGLAIAWEAARGGAEVVLADPRPGRGASWAAAGMLAPVTEVEYGEEALLELNLASNRAWPEFAEELVSATGIDIAYRRSGTVIVARDADDNAALDDVYAFQAKLGLDVRRLTGRETRALEPALAPRVRGGILVEGDHQVDNRALVEALRSACRDAGVTIVRTAVRALLAEGGRVRGVVLERGERVAAPAVVIAAGCRSAAIAGLPAGGIPVRPVKGQLLHLRSAHAGEPVLAGHNVRGLDVYVVPRADGRVVVGATVEERGFEEVVTAGAVRTLLEAAFELLPGIDELAFVEAVSGLRPATPDNAPLLGPGALEGLVVATGHYRNGVLLTPITARTITSLLATGRTPREIAPFDPRRFEGVRA